MKYFVSGPENYQKICVFSIRIWSTYGFGKRQLKTYMNSKTGKKLNRVEKLFQLK